MLVCLIVFFLLSFAHNSIASELKLPGKISIKWDSLKWNYSEPKNIDGGIGFMVFEHKQNPKLRVFMVSDLYVNQSVKLGSAKEKTERYCQESKQKKSLANTLISTRIFSNAKGLEICEIQTENSHRKNTQLSILSEMKNKNVKNAYFLNSVNFEKPSKISKVEESDLRNLFDGMQRK